jgi:tetratricopeptide (TPR) repeat protein
MTDRQLTFAENDIAHMVNGAYGKLRSGAFGEAAKLLERTLELDVEYEGVGAALKSVRFWVERQQRMEEIETSADRAGYLLDQWAAFRGFAARIGDLPERCYQDIKHYIHATVVAYLLQTSTAETSAAANAGYTRPSAQTQRLLLLGHSFKAMGDFANAIRYLEHARRLARDWAPLLAELADCYSLIEESRAAKIFFREAFFLGAAEIPIEELESPMIRRLLVAVEAAGVTRNVREWVPVYGVLLGAFSVTRELTALEYGKLRQSIFELEQRLGVNPVSNRPPVDTPEPSDDHAALIPRLINRYFWLIAHYLATHEERAKVDDILRRIKVLDIGVYQQYAG